MDKLQKNVEDKLKFLVTKLFIHGGVNTADQSEEKQFAEFDREKRIDKFKNDQTAWFLLQIQLQHLKVLACMKIVIMPSMLIELLMPVSLCNQEIESTD